jgi:hypothetical protein
MDGADLRLAVSIAVKYIECEMWRQSKNKVQDTGKDTELCMDGDIASGGSQIVTPEDLQPSRSCNYNLHTALALQIPQRRGCAQPKHLKPCDPTAMEMAQETRNGNET